MSELTHAQPHRVCEIDGCAKLHLSRGYCGMHYRRNRLYGDPLGGGAFQEATPSRLCSVPGCDRAHATAGLCSPHDARQRRHGSPTGGRSSRSLGIDFVPRPCSADGCSADSKCAGMCWSHFNKARYRADPETAARYGAEYRARQRGAVVEKFNASEIFERDRWRCGLCGKKISKTAKFPSPKSVSLDHVVPLSEGGEHSRRNTQASHLFCNLSKGARGGQQLMLLG